MTHGDYRALKIVNNYLHHFSFSGCPKNFFRSQYNYDYSSGEMKSCCTFDPPYYDCVHCDCYQMLEISGNYSTAVQACSSEYVWYSDSNAEIVSIESTENYYSLIDALLAGKISVLYSNLWNLDCNEWLKIQSKMWSTLFKQQFYNLRVGKLR